MTVLLKPTIGSNIRIKAGFVVGDPGSYISSHNEQTASVMLPAQQVAMETGVARGCVRDPEIGRAHV